MIGWSTMSRLDVAVVAVTVSVLAVVFALVLRFPPAGRPPPPPESGSVRKLAASRSGLRRFEFAGRWGVRRPHEWFRLSDRQLRRWRTARSRRTL